MKYLLLLLALPGLYASSIHVDLDTSSLAGNPFSVIFYFIDGDAAIDNTATVANAQFGGGTLLGLPSLITAGVSGSLATSLTLKETEFFNAYIHDFTAGSSLSFDLAFTRNFAGGSPDSLAFLLLDSATGMPVPTLDPLGTDVLLLIDLSSRGLPQAFATDPSRTSLTLPAPAVTATVTAVPEPYSPVLVAATLGVLFFGRRYRSNRS